MHVLVELEQIRWTSALKPRRLKPQASNLTDWYSWAHLPLDLVSRLPWTWCPLAPYLTWCQIPHPLSDLAELHARLCSLADVTQPATPVPGAKDNTLAVAEYLRSAN
jgi:hypothetical protein